MDWLQHIRSAYATTQTEYDAKPVFFSPAPQSEIVEAESRLGSKFSHDLCDLLCQTNGVGEEMTFQNGISASDLGFFVFNVQEIIEVTDYYRHSGLATNIDFGEMIFFGTPHTDGIYFAERKNENTIYAWYPSELEFRSISPNLPSFISDWLSGNLSI
jgi:hypothetical protein